jgi:hypothetical protein
MGVEMKSFGLQLCTEMLVIEDLAIKDNDNILIRTEQRLVTLRQIEDTQPSHAK